MAQISVNIGDRNGSTFKVDINPSGTMLSVEADYYMPPLYKGAEPYRYNHEVVYFHAEDREQLRAFLSALSAVQFPEVAQEPEESAQGVEAL